MSILFEKRNSCPFGYELKLMRAIQNELELKEVINKINEKKCKRISLYDGFDLVNNNSEFTLVFLRKCIEMDYYIDNLPKEFPEIWRVFKRPGSCLLKLKGMNENVTLFISEFRELQYIDFDFDIIDTSSELLNNLEILEEFVKNGVYLVYNNKYIRWFTRVRKEETKIWMQ